MSTQPPPGPPPALPPPGIALKDSTVNIRTITPQLRDFLVTFGRAHLATLGRDAVVTSGADGNHTKGSKHYEGLALDFRISDYSGRELFAVFTILYYLEVRFHLAVFDESQLLGAGHIHVEIAG